MNSRVFRHFAQTAGAVAICMVLLSPGAIAQSGDSSAAALGLVGTWRVRVTPVICDTGTPVAPSFTSLVQYARGGTSIAETSATIFQPGQRSAEIGVWESTGPQTYRSVREAFILYTAGPFQRGTQRITETSEVQGDQTTHTAKAEFFDDAGNLVRSNCSIAVGERFR
jgi:hypothetical protein